MIRRAGLVLLAALAGCGHGPVRERVRHDSVPPPAEGEQLAVRTPMGDVWFALTQPDSGPGGTCIQRTLEIRREGKRIPVPLLYTGGPAVPINDSTVRAELWRHCQPVGTYLVDLRTGQPRPEAP